MTGLWLRKVGPQCVFLAGVCWPRGTDRLSAFFLSNLMSIILFSFVFSFFLSFMATALPKGLSYFSPFLSSFPPVISCQLFLSHFYLHQFSSVQFSSVAQSCPTLCDLMNHSTSGLPVHHQLTCSDNFPFLIFFVPLYECTTTDSPVLLLNGNLGCFRFLFVVAVIHTHTQTIKVTE